MDDSAQIQTMHERQETAVAGCFAGFATGVWHPEDLVSLEGTPWIVVSAMRSIRGRGALLVLDGSSDAPAIELEWRPEAERGRRSPVAFDPHGINVRPLGEGAYELLVVDHGDGEAIARLTIETQTGRPVVVSGARIEKPAGTSGNAVAFVPGGGFVMTSMFDPRDPDVVGKFAAAEVTGGVWRWTVEVGWTRVGPELSGANGVAVSPDRTRIFVSEWAARRVWRLSIDGAVEACVDVDFLPDNLRWTQDGVLLLAGQMARPEAVFGCEARGEPCPMAFAVARVSPDPLRVAPLLRVSQAEAVMLGFGGATGALQVGDETWVGSFAGEKIGRFRLDIV